MIGMKAFFDTEFIENGTQHFPQLVSIGIVREDGAEYYAEFEVDWSLANQWVLDNVAPKLKGGDMIKTYAQAREEILLFCGDSPEIWAYFADYDWVIFCGIFGRMVDLPRGWPMYCRDLKQLMWHLCISNKDLREAGLSNENAHDALDDARWNKRVYNWIQESFAGSFPCRF